LELLYSFNSLLGVLNKVFLNSILFVLNEKIEYRR